MLSFGFLLRAQQVAYGLYKSNTSGKVISRLQFCQEVFDGLATSMHHLNELPRRRIPVPPCRAPAKTKLIKLAGTKSIVNERLFGNYKIIYVHQMFDYT